MVTITPIEDANIQTSLHLVINNKRSKNVMGDSQVVFYYWNPWASIPQSHTLITPLSMYFLWAPIPACLPIPGLRAVGGGAVTQRNYILYTYTTYCDP